MITTVYDGRFAYKPGRLVNEAACHIQLLKNEETGKWLCIATEISDNPGKSVTNSCEHIATAIAQQYHIAPENLIFLEHYGVMSYQGGGKYALEEYEHYDDVTFTWLDQDQTHASWQRPEAFRPEWTRMEGEHFALLLQHFGLLSIDAELEEMLSDWYNLYKNEPASEYDLREDSHPSFYRQHHQNISKLLSFHYLEPERSPATYKTQLRLTERALAHLSKCNGL